VFANDSIVATRLEGEQVARRWSVSVGGAAQSLPLSNRARRRALKVSELRRRARLARSLRHMHLDVVCGDKCLDVDAPRAFDLWLDVPVRREFEDARRLERDPSDMTSARWRASRGFLARLRVRAPRSRRVKKAAHSTADSGGDGDPAAPGERETRVLPRGRRRSVVHSCGRRS
jgi:hypothetical protein